MSLAEHYLICSDFVQNNEIACRAYRFNVQLHSVEIWLRIQALHSVQVERVAIVEVRIGDYDRNPCKRRHDSTFNQQIADVNPGGMRTSLGVANIIQKKVQHLNMYKLYKECILYFLCMQPKR